jgi:hypothetical protein
MSDYPLDLDEISTWLRSKNQASKDRGVTLAGVRESQTHVPAAAADFDAERAIGRISAWISGQIDFEVLRRSDGEYAFFRHESVSSLASPAVESAFGEFIRTMMHPEAAISEVA